VSSALGFLTLNGNQIILSFYVDEKTLGIFSIATFILLALSQVTGKVFGSVFFPMLSQSARLGAEHIEASYLKIKRKIDPIIFFLATFFYFSGEALITLIYDSRYEEAGGILSILSLSLIALCSRVTFQLYFALGLSKVTSTIALINTSLLFTIVPLVLYWSNLNYALWAMALVSASRALIAFYYEYRYFGKLFINPLFIAAAIIAGWGSGQLFSTVILALKAMI